MPHKQEKVVAKASKIEETEPVEPAPAPAKKVTIPIYYAGVFDRAGRLGKVTGKEYSFGRDKFLKPIAVEVDEEDVPAFLAEKGAGCVSHAPNRLFVTKAEYEGEVEEARKENKITL